MNAKSIVLCARIEALHIIVSVLHMVSSTLEQQTWTLR